MTVQNLFRPKRRGGHTRPRLWKATEDEAREMGVAPGTRVGLPTRAAARAERYNRRYRAAKTADERLRVTFDYLRTVVVTARKRDEDRHVPDVPGIDPALWRVEALIRDVAREIEQAGRIPARQTRGA